ncbi:related to Sterol esterase 2 [Saccharomycodes ludwigii]|uniref:Related to Sterol esterase 2 n=1 Tax=Saccharomycodes ludwigii TaxID=36035 RepID=A0A376B1Y5_9ASCO|nr:hypothetical protein SCDLUD_004793 [Saccharomycodes ludwigii]KAH3899353.1 hypothetical protein SCDLUD_004793 [Saccharomycodes ludwigii]SSD58629.1 related to Sterol esterase 2 [Saccharomycodes ludwigii]
MLTTQFLGGLFFISIIHQLITPKSKARDEKAINNKIKHPAKIIFTPATRSNSSNTNKVYENPFEHVHDDENNVQHMKNNDGKNNGKTAGSKQGLFFSEPTELVPDLNYYFQQYGLLIEPFKVTTEDGFVLDLWHIINPSIKQGNVSGNSSSSLTNEEKSDSKRKGKLPILFIHGLLQSSGSFASSGTESIAYYLSKIGERDCWLGNNRCGFDPEWDTTKLKQYKKGNGSTSVKWDWDIQEMCNYDLPCLVDFVLMKTGCFKLNLIGHSQGTMQSLLSLVNKTQLINKIDNFVALSPAIYPGELLYKKIPVILMAFFIDFKLVYGIKSFIPLMLKMRNIMVGTKIFSNLSYIMFNYLFDWSDTLWNPKLRNRHFLFSPVAISVKLMRWWLSPSNPSFRNGKFSKAFFPDDKIWFPTVEYHEHNATADISDNFHKHQLKNSGNEWPKILIFAPKQDRLVDGARLINHFTTYEDPTVYKIWYIEDYSHLDVLWAKDVITKIAQPILEHI